MTITIRNARPADAACIADFNARLALETEDKRLDTATVLQGVEALLTDPAKGIYFLAEVDESVVGQLSITREWSDWRNAWFWWVQSVYVEAEFRGQGVFSSLFRHAWSAAGQEGSVCAFRLYVESENDRAQSTYERLGMKRTSYLFYEQEFKPVVESIETA
jgi:ribosomal protein S18 acetylase RimI-like enzyme